MNIFFCKITDLRMVPFYRGFELNIILLCRYIQQQKRSVSQRWENCCDKRGRSENWQSAEETVRGWKRRKIKSENGILVMLNVKHGGSWSHVIEPTFLAITFNPDGLAGQKITPAPSPFNLPPVNTPLNWKNSLLANRVFYLKDFLFYVVRYVVNWIIISYK